MIKYAILSAAAAVAIVGTALAQAAAPAELVAAYKAGVAAEKCGMKITSELSSQLGDAVQRIEQRSGMAQADLDALWAQYQASATADPEGFCPEAMGLIDTVIASAG